MKQTRKTGESLWTYFFPLVNCPLRLCISVSKFFSLSLSVPFFLRSSYRPHEFLEFPLFTSPHVDESFSASSREFFS